MRIPIKSMPLISDCGDLESEQENEVFVDTAKSFDEPECLEDDEDPFYKKALELVLQSGKISASFIQSKLEIPYSKAVILLDKMEENGIVELKLVDNAIDEDLDIKLNDIAEDLPHYKELADNGNKKIQKLLGDYYRADDNFDEAIKYFEMAEAYASIGLIYQYDYRDDSEAVKYFKKGADLNDPESIYRLGIMYSLGRGGLGRNEEKAYSLYMKAANMSYAPAMKQLGALYLEGDDDLGIMQNDRLAFNWYTKALETDKNLSDFTKSDIHVRLGEMYLKGNSYIDEDEAEAFNHFAEANKTDEKNIEARWLMGYCYFEGIGVDRDEELAVEYFQSSKLVISDAKFYLGLAYYYGRGTAKDEDIGLFYIRLAAEDFCRDAEKWLRKQGIK